MEVRTTFFEAGTHVLIAGFATADDEKLAAYVAERDGKLSIMPEYVAVATLYGSAYDGGSAFPSIVSPEGHWSLEMQPKDEIAVFGDGVRASIVSIVRPKPREGVQRILVMRCDRGAFTKFEKMSSRRNDFHKYARAHAIDLAIRSEAVRFPYLVRMD